MGDGFDASLLAIEDSIFGVKATAVDFHFGGEDFDKRLADTCQQGIKRQNRGALVHDMGCGINEWLLTIEDGISKR